MKKVLLSLAACASLAAANAQHSGGIFVYGGVGFNYDKPSSTFNFPGGSSTFEVKNQSAFVTPGIGFQLNEHLGIGLNFSYMLSKSDSTGSGGGVSQFNNRKMTDFAVGPFIRYTQHLGQYFFTYAQFNASYLHGKETEENNFSGPTLTDEESYNGFGFNIVPAIGINLSRCIAITGSFGDVGYSHKKYKLPDPGVAGFSTDQKNDAFGINFGKQFTLGVQWNLGGGMHHTHREPMDETRNMDTSDDEDGGSKKKKSRKDDDE
jgi:hypothetical protein